MITKEREAKPTMREKVKNNPIQMKVTQALTSKHLPEQEES